MTPVQIVTMVLNGIATLAVNPNLSGGGIGSQRTSQLLRMLSTLIQGGQETWEELKKFAEEIQALVDQHGEPTRGQWEAMLARDLTARAKLVENRERLEREVAEETPAPPQSTPADPPIDPESLTKAVLQEKLNAAGVEYKTSATKDELVQLYREHLSE